MRSVSKQGQLQPRLHSKARLLSPLRTMPLHIRDFSAFCGAKFESQLGNCTENNKRNRPKESRTARKFLLCGITIQFKIYYSYGFGSWEVNKEDVTVITHVVRWEVLFFLALKVAISALPLYGLDSFRRKIWVWKLVFIWLFFDT